jgi:hypothetical protein
MSWKIIKVVIKKKKSSNNNLATFLINGIKTDNPETIVTSFNNYFTSLGPTLDKKIANSKINPISYIKKAYPNNIFLNPCSEEEISKIIDGLKSCSAGWDEIPSNIIKINKHIRTPIITHIVNQSFLQGKFPDELKIANIIPIFKSGDQENIGNYRPISLLTTFSKIFERAFNNRLCSFLKKFNILYKLQFGFRENHSAHMALTILIDRIFRL